MGVLLVDAVGERDLGATVPGRRGRDIGGTP